MLRKILSVLSMLLLALIIGCDTNPSGLTQTKSSALKPAYDCQDVLELLKYKIALDMKKKVEENLDLVLTIKEKGCNGFYDEMMEDTNGVPFPGGARAEEENSGESAKQYSTTNTQVAGVDEADFIKNDGAYIYILADGEFKIIDAWPAPQAKKVSSTKVEGKPQKLFVYQDMALIYSSLQGDSMMQCIDEWCPGQWQTTECTYGYDCEFTGDRFPLKITVFDIKDKTNPKLIRETYFSGSYLNSRRIDDVVHTVVIYPEVRLPELQYWPKELQDPWQYCWSNKDMPYTYLEILIMFEEVEKHNLEIINKLTIEDVLPSIKDIRYEGGNKQVDSGLLDNCQNFYLSQAGDGKSFISLVSQRINDLTPLNATTIVGKPGAVYASKESLYIAERHYLQDMDGWYYTDTNTIKEATTIHKFALETSTTKTKYVGSGVVKGRILNQFSMDEYKGFLRIATTMGHVPDPNVYSTVSVLQEFEGQLVLVGMIDHIAPKEDIRSVRFNGDIGFVVTFKKTDPLFVIDLSNPQNPVIKGELKIPGYSTYMHILDDNHVLSIGFDADDQGAFAWFQGIQLQVFDVSELSKPKLMFKEVIGTRGTASEAATNHLAFNYFSPKQLLAIPIVICKGGSGGMFGNEMTFSGLLVYKLTLEEGFKLLGGIPHQEKLSGEKANNYCYQWWSGSTSVVKRSIFMDDYAYSVALDLIQVSNISDLEHPVASIPLTD